MPSTIPIDEVQPSQLYLDASKLRQAVDWFDFGDPTYDPIPVLSLNDETVLSDGHTRAFLAHLSGEASLEIVPEPNREELSIDLYRECIDWCYEEDVTTVADFAGRIVDHKTYANKWVARCHESPHYDEE